MIFETLQVLKEDVDAYFLNKGVSSVISLSNIGTIDSDNDSSNDISDVLLTLVNIQEEYTLKNINNNYVHGNTVDYQNPRTYLNLYILFGITNPDYKEALKRLTTIIKFFQSKKIFTQSNTTFKREGDMFDIGDFKFIVELYTPSFEELNHIWGTLGGKQYPSVLYKIRLIEIDSEKVLEKGKVIGGLLPNLNQN